MAAFYLLAMAALALHLYHGTWAAVRTLGAARPSAQPLHRTLALLLAIVVSAGFMIIPIATLAGAFVEAPPLVETSATAVSPAPAAAIVAGEAR